MRLGGRQRQKGYWVYHKPRKDYIDEVAGLDRKKIHKVVSSTFLLDNAEGELGCRINERGLLEPRPSIR